MDRWMRPVTDMKKLILGSGIVFGSAVGVAAIVGGSMASSWLDKKRGGSRMDLRGKVVLITGGSHGLGVALARRFARKGASLVLCARDQAELDRVRHDLAKYEGKVFTMTCDVGDREQVARLIDASINHYGHLDVVVNNAGVIRVGPVESMTIEDYENAMNTMFWGTVYTTLAALPHLRERAQARIVNITSIGARVSVPHLVPYSCAKFACAAFSEGMRSELGATGVKVVTIAPGLMRTGSHINAEFKGAEDGEAAWFSLGASLPGVSMGAERAAAQIVSATEKGTAEKILSAPANLLSRFHGLFPGMTADILGLVSQLLPRGGNATEKGRNTAILQRPSIYALTTLGRWAAEKYLQPGAKRFNTGNA